MYLAEQLAEFIANTDYSAMPQKVVEKAKQCMMDSIGVSVYGTQFEPPKIALAFANEAGGREESTVIGTQNKLPCFLAALVNGVASHVADYDDSGGFGHPSGILMPTTLALSEAKGIDGRTVIAAFIIGNEIASKLAQIMMFKHYEVGFHSTGTLGTIAAAAASAKLLNLTPAQTTNALGIAASSASGIRQNFGTMTKCWHSGHAASSGMMAALVAKKGYDASPQSLDGKTGFIHAFQGTDAKFPVEKLGNPYSVMEIMFKKYPSCHGTHAAVDAILSLKKQHSFAPEDINTIKCLGRPLMNTVLIYKEPVTGLQAKFSLEYCAGAAASLGCLGIAQFTDEAVMIPVVRETMNKVSSIEDQAIGDLAVKKQLLAPSNVTIVLKDGQELNMIIEEARGGPQDPLKWTEIEEKFLGCTGDRSLPETKAKQAIEMIRNLENIKKISELTSLLQVN